MSTTVKLQIVKVVWRWQASNGLPQQCVNAAAGMKCRTDACRRGGCLKVHSPRLLQSWSNNTLNGILRQCTQRVWRLL